jgi:peroxiredoxin
MANDLTGDFDVVAEFSIPGVNRVLAAMHRAGRFPHSTAIRVDDVPPPSPHAGLFTPLIVGIVDSFGDAAVNHNLIPASSVLPGQLTTGNRLSSALDLVVNGDLAGVEIPPIVPSHLRGRAQLQVFPPRIEVADGSGTNITVRLQFISRYFPDPHTSPLAEFVRGEVRITASVNQIASQTANVVEIELKANNLIINFTPIWSNKPLSAADLAAVSLLIRNALKASFLPSTATLPSNVKHMQFKTLLGAQSAVAALLNIDGPRGNPASVNNVFLGAGDAFAFAAGRDFILAAFNQAVGDVAGQQFQFSFDIDWPWPVPNQHVVYTVTLNSATVDLQSGKIVLTIAGRATTPSWNIPNFNFRVRQVFTLRLAGATAELEVDGDVSLEITTGGIAGWLVNRFKNRALPTIRQRRDQIVNQTQTTVRRMLDANANLGGFLNSLLNPSIRPPISRGQETLRPELAYTSFEIKPSGIVLHGSLAVPAWPQPHVEFEHIPANSGGGIGPGDTIFHGPDYTALKSWIPGGTIQRYEWSYKGQTQPFHIDENRFVLIHPPPEVSTAEASTEAASGLIPPEIFDGVASTGAVTGFKPICLTVRGTRIASSGPAVAQPVSGTVCGYTKVSVLQGLESSLDGALLMVALAQPGPRGLVEVAGHASARSDGASGGTPNRIVHFADERTIGHLEFLTQALRESGRKDAATAILAVLVPDLMAKSRFTEGVIYAEDQGGNWARAFGVNTTQRPLTLVVGPKGDIVWQQEGELDSATLAAALRRVLVKSEPVRPRMQWSNLRIGRPTPNFLFEYAPGRGLTLRKLEGRPVVLIFWKSSSKPSLETVRDLQETTRKAGGDGPVVLAINDGETPELAKKIAAENRLSAILVPDPKRSISLAYGVNLWPTTVFIDTLGLVREIRYGRFAGEHAEYPSPEKLPTQVE